MKVRYFDIHGRQMTFEQVQSLNICTPIMEHVLATVNQRVATASSKAEIVSTSGELIEGIHFV